MSFFLKNKIKIFGLNPLIFLILIFILSLNIYYVQHLKKEILWNSFLTSLFFVMILGFGLNFIGEKIPFLNKLGLGFLLCILVPSYLVYKEIIGPFILEKINYFCSKNNNGIDFHKLFIVITITGSLFNIEFNLLKKVILKFITLSLLSIFISFIIIGFLGYLLNYKIPKTFKDKSQGSFIDTIFFIFIPLTNGGTNLGINGSSDGSYKKVFNKTSKEIKSILLAPLIIARVFSIFFAGLLYCIFNKTKFSGEGQLQKKDPNLKINKISNLSLDYQNIGIGLLIILGFYSTGSMINALFAEKGFILDELVYVIILSLIFQIFNLMPKEYKNYIIQTGKFMIVNFTSPMLVLLGLTTDFKILLTYIIDFNIMFLVLSSLLITIICSFFFSLLFNLYPLETSLIVGISSYSIGSTGNVGVMSISHRIELLSLSMIITRIIGIIVFILSSIFVFVFYS